ncbi:HlyD family secretion protein [Martelella lutilitoris]|uniref:HlyD family secretion protein n=1 Tax=Martelella lutilitoris TaxID=2583532 RepID=A0A5C4JQG2_9HYPH|nr:biotin/lipoyl-binding protein [Martelella lutilitoris]TNB47384.1 HlyD family secretion protein [Martelella lutilitoris]
MLELLFCSLFTILPDFLYRRYKQGKRLGREINLFTVWYELRWGITGCTVLTILLITTVFFYHPTSTTVSSYFRTVSILPDTPGRVTEVYVKTGDTVEAGDVIFTLDDRQQQAAVNAAREKVAEVEAQQAVAEQELEAARATVEQAQSALDHARIELDRNLGLQQRNADAVAQRVIDALQSSVSEKQSALDVALANRRAVEARIETLLPTQKAGAEAALQEAEVALDQRSVRAGIAGNIQQFQLRPGDVVNPFVRPAGILVPRDQEEGVFVAGFGQLTAQVIHPGMIGELACATQPFKIIPVVVDRVQDVIAAGQFRPSDSLMDVNDRNGNPGTVIVRLRPLYDGQAASIPPGSACIANVYTSNYEKYKDPGIGLGQSLLLHMIDTVGILHAALLRLEVILLPVNQLVLSGGH